MASSGDVVGRVYVYMMSVRDCAELAGLRTSALKYVYLYLFIFFFFFYYYFS